MWPLFFGLPAMFGSIHRQYFSHANLAKLSVFFEIYYILTRQYGVNILRQNDFAFVARKAAYLARHVAMKNKVQHLAHINNFSALQVDAFLEERVPDNSICSSSYMCVHSSNAHDHYVYDAIML